MQMFSPGRKAESPPVAPRDDVPAAGAQGANSNSVEPPSGGILSNGVEITGTIKFDRELMIDGSVDGTIESGGRLTVGKNAQIRGQITTRSIAVHGTIEGNISATERCDLRSGCTLRGDVEAPRLVVDENATFIGNANIATRQNSPA